MMDDKWFTDEMARKIMGGEEYNHIRSQIYNDFYKTHMDDKTGSIRYAKDMTRSQGYGMFRAASYVLADIKPTEEFIEAGTSAGKTSVQIMHEWNKKKKHMLVSDIIRRPVPIERVVGHHIEKPRC